MELQRSREAIETSGYGLAAISYDPPGALKAFADRHGITFPLLSDAGSPTIRSWKLLNTNLPQTDEYFGIPFPGTFMIDPRGIVTSRFVERSYGERHTSSSILARLGGRGGASVTRLDTPHLFVETRLSDPAAALGAHVTLILDVTPKRGFHVYAPPQTSYRAVALILEEDPRVSAAPIEFPQSEEYLFKPLNERVQVYQRPFRLVQNVTLPLSAASRQRAAAERTLVIRGTLSYQACDDRVCHLPASIPVSWTIEILPFNMPGK